MYTVEELEDKLIDLAFVEDPRDVIAPIPLWNPGVDSYQDCTSGSVDQHHGR